MRCIFSSIRSVDLHGMDRITARITVDEFITDLIRLKEAKGSYYSWYWKWYTKKRNSRLSSP